MVCSFSLTAFVSATKVSRLVSMVLARFCVLTRSVMPMYFAPSSVARIFAVVVFPTPGVPVTRMAWVILFPFCLCLGYGCLFYKVCGGPFFGGKGVGKGLKGFK